jgi:hypothetical protein
MTAFFIPGLAAADELSVEGAYGKMRDQTELELGRRPASRRIFRLWTRRGSLDCVTEVGRRDPLRGGTVVAILDMGSRQPYVVWWRQTDSGREAMEVLGSSAYSVLEFDG